eukprot:756064-Hanusia_phi.AAC.3
MAAIFSVQSKLAVGTSWHGTCCRQRHGQQGGSSDHGVHPLALWNRYAATLEERDMAELGEAGSSRRWREWQCRGLYAGTHQEQATDSRRVCEELRGSVRR